MGKKEVLWKRDILVFLVSQNLSLFGSSLVQYAITWHITLTTQSGTMMALAIISGFVPSFFISPLGGVWADRFDRKRLIVLSDGAIAVTTLIVAVLFTIGLGSIPLLLVAMAVRALGAGVQVPAVNAMVPDIVPEKELLRINGITGSVRAVVNIATPALSAFLLSVAPFAALFYIDVVTAAFAIFLMTAVLKVPRTPFDDSPSTSQLAEIRQGLVYIRNHTLIRTLFIYIALFYALISPLAFLTPLQVARSFGSDVWRLGTLEVFFGAGMIIGGSLIAGVLHTKKPLHILLSSMVIFTVTTLYLALIGNFILYIAGIFISGIALPLYNSPFITIIQKESDPRVIGRVFSVEMMISSAFMPLSMLLFGPLSDIISVELILVIASIAMGLMSVSMIASRSLRSSSRSQL
ncbi:MAG: MFS transporter [Sphaerochaetaceae bacterium]|nr:MFS transporter [Sphaerochaetaceae bacterium]